MDVSVSTTVRLYFIVEKVVLWRGSDATEIMQVFFFVFMDFKNGKFNFICVGQERDDRRQSSLTIISIKSFFLCDGVVQKCQLLSGQCNKKKSFCKPAFSTVFFFLMSKKGKKILNQEFQSIQKLCRKSYQVQLCVYV